MRATTAALLLLAWVLGACSKESETFTRKAADWPAFVEAFEEDWMRAHP